MKQISYNDLLMAEQKASETAKRECEARLNSIAKPLHSLGKLEEMMITIAGVRETSEVTINKKALIVMCSDNGIVEEGVSQSGMEVTKIVAENLLKEETCAAIMAKQQGVDLYPIDIGIASDTCVPNYKISYGTKNFLKEPAMTKEQAIQAIETGANLVASLKEQGYDIICTGEMGIANTTTSSILASVLLDAPVELVTGKGAGLSKEGIHHKCDVIKKALLKYDLSKERPLELLATVGGYDIAGLVGVFLGGMIERIPVVMDGFISTVAALLACELNSNVKDFLLASHVSKEPAGQMLLNRLDKQAVIHADLCLGEGTGALAVLPLLDLMVTIYHKMSTFHQIGMEDYKEL